MYSYRRRFPREDAPGAGQSPVQEADDAGKDAQAEERYGVPHQRITDGSPTARARVAGRKRQRHFSPVPLSTKWLTHLGGQDRFDTGSGAQVFFLLIQ